MSNQILCLSNNANGPLSRKRRIKMFKYFKDKIGNNGIVFLQETHSSEDTYNEWRDEVVYFSHTVRKVLVEL